MHRLCYFVMAPYSCVLAQLLGDFRPSLDGALLGRGWGNEAMIISSICHSAYAIREH